MIWNLHCSYWFFCKRCIWWSIFRPFTIWYWYWYNLFLVIIKLFFPVGGIELHSKLSIRTITFILKHIVHHVVHFLSGFTASPILSCAITAVEIFGDTSVSVTVIIFLVMYGVAVICVVIALSYLSYYLPAMSVLTHKGPRPHVRPCLSLKH